MNEKRWRVLVAEDEAIVALELQQLLTRYNFNVVAVVKSGEDLVKESKSKYPDIIITDIHLKGKLDGIEATIEINKDPKKIPIIFVTGFNDEFTHAHAMAVSPKAYLLKPFNEKVLINSLNNCVA